MAINQEITWALHEAERRILTAVQGGGSAGWCSVCDEDGNPNVPTTEREVLVFLCGDRSLIDERPNDAGYGLRLGWFDTDKQHWRVSGSRCGYVTHWRECPEPPAYDPENQDEVPKEISTGTEVEIAGIVFRSNNAGESACT